MLIQITFINLVSTFKHINEDFFFKKNHANLLLCNFDLILTPDWYRNNPHLRNGHVGDNYMVRKKMMKAYYQKKKNIINKQ